MPFPLEICIDSLESARTAGPYLGPGDRFEVCASLLAGGGLTPSMGLVRALRADQPHIGLMVMVRPRPGSFVYTPAEVEVMLLDIQAAREAGAVGVVFGCLTVEGEVDAAVTTQLCKAAEGMEVTFHRAFDVTPSWQRACDTLASIPGITRILTSGHALTALEGAAELDALTRHLQSSSSSFPLTILPASGINAMSLAELRNRAPLLQEAHLSASGIIPPPDASAVAIGKVLGFGSGEEWRLDGDKLKAVRELVDREG